MAWVKLEVAQGIASLQPNSDARYFQKVHWFYRDFMLSLVQFKLIWERLIICGSSYFWPKSEITLVILLI